MANPTHTMLMAVSMAFHNIGEGSAVAAAFIEATGQKRRAVIVATCTGLVEPVSAVLSVAIFSSLLTKEYLDYSLIGVGGIMLTVSLKELLPQALRNVPSIVPGMVGFAAGVVMMAIVLSILGGE